MPEIDLPSTYSWQGQIYGPGKANVPKELAEAIANERKLIEEKATAKQTTPVKLPEEQLKDLENNNEHPPASKRKGNASQQ